MGRPPNPHGRRSAELGKKFFTVPIPPVDPRVHAAVESRIASTHPWLVQRAKLDKAESQLVSSRAKQEDYTQKVSLLLQNKQQALNEISALRTRELQQSLEHLATRMTTEFQQQQAQERAQVLAECDDLWNNVPEEEEEPPTKRMKLEDGNTEEGEVVGQVQGSTETSQEAGDTTVSNVAFKAATSEQEEPKPSQLKKKELEVAESEVEGLTETKHQMIWLLKQVIKAEQKQKMQAKASTAAVDGKTT